MTTTPSDTPTAPPTGGVLDWTDLLHDQLAWHWAHQLRPRLAGLTDGEYLWEPAPGCWSLRLTEGRAVPDFAAPEPDPAPVTTIAWRLAHVIVGILAVRSAAHFGREATDYQSFEYAATADEALSQLDDEIERWLDGVRALGAEGLAGPCGPAEGPFAERPLAELVLHINRELIHHLAEVSLLRDLYRARTGDDA